MDSKHANNHKLLWHPQPVSLSSLSIFRGYMWVNLILQSASILRSPVESLPDRGRSKSRRQLARTGRHTPHTLTRWHTLEYPWEVCRKGRGGRDWDEWGVQRDKWLKVKGESKALLSEISQWEVSQPVWILNTPQHIHIYSVPALTLTSICRFLEWPWN